jgi:hypothetical protein
MTFGTHQRKFAHLSVLTGWIRREFAVFTPIFDRTFGEAMNPS